MKLRRKIRFLIHKLFYDPTFNNCRIDTMVPGAVEIGENFIAAPGSAIQAHNAGLVNKTGEYIIGKVKIGNNVFLGANAVVLPGVTIGDNCIIGANSVIARNIPANMVASGNPAQILYSVDHYREFCKLSRRVELLDIDTFKNRKQIKNRAITKRITI